MNLGPDEREIHFPARQALPPGWRIIQLDSGHYMGVHDDDIHETSISVNRFHVRRWCIAAYEAETRALQSEGNDQGRVFE